MTSTEDSTLTNRSVKTDIKRDLFESKIQNLVPRIGYILSQPVLPAGNTFFDVLGNILYISNGTSWVPVANASTFDTTTDDHCDPTLTAVIEPASSISATNVGIAVVPKGNGAISAANPDSAATGGNCRGTFAIDLQLQRGAAAQVASAAGSTIGGGNGNTASGINSCVPGGVDNVAAGVASLAAGDTANAATANSMCFSCDPVAGATTTVASEFKIGVPAAGRVTITNLPAFNDDAAAGVGGLTTGMLYQTTGGGAITVAGVVAIKQ